MIQAVQFIDFGLSGTALQKWRTLPILDHYRRQYDKPEWSNPIFCDSGGFRLLRSAGIDLSRFSLAPTAETIFRLQRDFGCDLIASLDHPLRPGLTDAQVRYCLRTSQLNAMHALRLAAESTFKPLIYIAVHGRTPAEMRSFVRASFRRIKREGLGDQRFGLAVGSLVPLRGSGKAIAILQIVQAAVQAIPEEFRDRVPVHVFGVSGNLIPPLVLAGVDTFDSSTYAQEARGLKYIDPETRRATPILEMDVANCGCGVCRNVGLAELQDAFLAPTRVGQPVSGGHPKSKYYADLALHNLSLDLDIVTATRSALASDILAGFVADHLRANPRLARLATVFSDDHPEMRTIATRVSIPASPLPVPAVLGSLSTMTAPGRLTAKAFDIGANGYKPPDGKSILLLVPCSETKPYSASRTHMHLSKHLHEHLGSVAGQIHKVTLSGLFGPVPHEYEDHPVVSTYDFHLDPHDYAQRDLLVERLLAYVNRHSQHYSFALAYATTRAYRTVFERAGRYAEGLVLLPSRPRSRRLTEFFRTSNLAELTLTLNDHLSQDSA